jgi:hypothetical protein
MSDENTLPELHTEKVFKGKIYLDVRDSEADWGHTALLWRPGMHPTSSSFCTMIRDWRLGRPTGDGSTCRRLKSSQTVG